MDRSEEIKVEKEDKHLFIWIDSSNEIVAVDNIVKYMDSKSSNRWIFYCFVIYGCITKVACVTYRTSECYKFNQSWTNTEPIDVLYPVSEPNECQTLCQVFLILEHSNSINHPRIAIIAHCGPWLLGQIALYFHQSESWPSWPTLSGKHNAH